MAHERRIFVDLEANHPGFKGLASHEGANTAVQLSESQAHHLFSVLRLKEGDHLVVVDRLSPRQFEARIESVPGRKKGSRGVVVLKEEMPAEANLASGVLLFPICKPKAVELVCEKATELNIAQIIFWQADRSVVRVGGDADQRDRQQRLAAIAESAACQSARSSIPTVRVVPSLDVALDLVSVCSVKLFGHLGEGAQPLPGRNSSNMQASLGPQLQPPLLGPAIAVGPEGDFTDRELALFDGAGFKPVTLGPTRLRSETAALVMLGWLVLSL
jgi:16S rRNA (uracil1498-N3)-methyltransferase